MKRVPEEHKINTPYDHKEVTSILANERTYAAWLRTGLTALATALVAHKFLPGDFTVVSLRGIVTLLLLCSMLCFFLAAWRYQHVGSRLDTIKVFGAPVYLLMISSSLLIIVAIISLYGIWE